MSNEYTVGTDVFQPEVLGDVLTTYLYNNSALLGSGYVEELSGAIWNRGGKTVTFPVFKGLTTGAVKNLPDDGTAVESNKIEMDDYTKSVISKIISVRFTGSALEDALADADIFGRTIEQIGIAAKDTVDKALVTEASTTTLEHDSGASPAYDEIVTAKMKWADKAQSKDAILIVHSDVYAEILKLDEVKTFNNWGASAAIQTGNVPYIAGMPIIVSDNIAKDGTEYTNLIVARGALQFGMRRDLTMEVKNVPGNDVKVLDTYFRFVTHLKETNPFGVIKYVTDLAY